MIRVCAFLLTLFAFNPVSAQMVDIEPGVSLELAQHRKSILSDIHYGLRFNIPAEQTNPISSQAVVEFVLADNSQALLLDFRESPDKIARVRSNGRDIATQWTMEHLLIPGSALEEGSNRLEIEFTAGDTSLNRNPDFLYTLFVPDRARTAFPLFDQPNLKATYELTLNVPAAWQAISNAPLLETTINGNRKELRFARSDLISSYLFSFVAGRFEAITRTVAGREMTMLHRETDAEKVARNLDAIFSLHGAALEWLEDYTGIPYPFQKFDFALIPSFQYGGMEHVGAIQYRADGLFLDESPSQTRLLARASLISHETAHMWFGDLVTMDWFNDVWTKEVFANFMAAKIVNPSYPDIDHELSFLLRHYPSAYAVDRSAGTHPIRQVLPNLNEAGTLYGNIIYNKAPIMMRQLEALIGASNFQLGMQQYLREFALDNATWPELIAILDELSDEDLGAWSEVWVNSPGRPRFYTTVNDTTPALAQRDPAALDRHWPQRFSVAYFVERSWVEEELDSDSAPSSYDSRNSRDTAVPILFNADGFGYGLFPATLSSLQTWDSLDPVQRGSVLISLYENMLEDSAAVPPADMLQGLIAVIQQETDQQLLTHALNRARTIYWTFLDANERLVVGPQLEQLLWEGLLDNPDSSSKKIFFDNYRDITLSERSLGRLQAIWAGESQVQGLNLAETDFIDLAVELAIKLPQRSDEIVSTQLQRIDNEDRRRRLAFMAPALSADVATRDSFFEELSDSANRETESWVLAALAALHHPLRLAESEKYLLPSLELLEEIQSTGDIFFPARWLSASLGNYRSEGAADTVREFLDSRPDYNYQLRLKILQAADLLLRSSD